MKYFLITLVAAISLWGCRKENNGPAEMYTPGLVFDSLDKNGTNAQLYLNNIYADMPKGFNRIDYDMLDVATDDAMPSRSGTNSQIFIKSNLSNTNNPDDSWSQNYASIRKVNIFLSQVGIVPVPAKIPYWKAEARFLRALFYFELVKRYGGVPLIGDTVFNAGDVIRLKRNTFDQCITYISNECDSIKGAERVEPLSTTDWGKASRGAVMALKSRVLLYAASPLFNGGVAAGATAEQQSLMGYPTYDVERWNKAAVAANDLLNLGSTAYSLEPTYNTVFLNRQNKEVIISYLRGTTNDLETNNGPVGFGLGGAGYGNTSPTQDLVNAFPMANGKAITDPSSGYNLNDPYTNRDPRLANTVFYNNLAWLSRPVQLYEGGLDKPNTPKVQTVTGYYMRKFLGNFATSTSYSAQNHNFPIFRLAEIMLNYAEALNEYSGPVAAVYTNLINIRKRAGIAAGTDNKYGLSATLTKDQMRDVIHNERRIEMAFEEQRFWDLRRWKVAETVLNKNLSGIKIAKTLSGTFTYAYVTAGQISFAFPKMYLYPVPFSEMSTNSNLTQNYGW